MYNILSINKANVFVMPCLLTYYPPTYLPIFYISKYVHLKTYVGRHVYIYLVRYLLMKNIEVQMLSYTLTKKFFEVQENILNIFGIILFYKMVWWFDGQNISVQPKRPRFNPLYPHVLCEVWIFIYILCTCV
jgi:hypothetical protein